MLQSIRIERFRGLELAELADLGALTVITGPNGSGKTSVMEAAFVASSSKPANALAEVVQRRSARGGARWVVGDPYSRIVVETDETSTASTLDYKVELFDTRRAGSDFARQYRDGLELRSEDPTTGGPMRFGRVGFDEENHAVVLEAGTREGTSSRWVDPDKGTSPTDLYSRLVRTGRKKVVLDALRRAMPRFQEFEILTESDGVAQLYVMQDGRGIPLGLAGDGVAKMVSMAMHVASAGDEVVFIEEPENFLHPRAMVESAKIMWDSVAEGAQLVLSTHSLEFIDALLPEDDEQLDHLVLFNVALEDGRLAVSRLSGPEIMAQRTVIEGDLR